ncbi:cuticle protein 10.9-like [Argiope bruennichi]|uniref:Cuticle protein 16.8 like protein n=1 Tax=Argiope bruennichi TaxID=94029 RepID=A0A8T0ECP7_ARGBR|nr:cuticle protein 10.9-like [Argiope bruennichi]KAF8770902.1 Cuticle protein 16.8 like protein [Argiope bruennichi]
MTFFGFTVIAFATLAIVSAFQNPTSPIRQEVRIQPPQPYEFAYKTADDKGTKQHRTEAADSSGTVTGSYGYVDPFGMYRRVEYVADVNGYRATVHSNEPGMTSNGAASAAYFAEVPPPAIVAQGLAYLSPVQSAKL